MPKNSCRAVVSATYSPQGDGNRLVCTQLLDTSRLVSATYSPQGDGNYSKSSTHTLRSSVSATYSPQGDGNTPWLSIGTPGSTVSATYSPQGDGNTNHVFNFLFSLRMVSATYSPQGDGNYANAPYLKPRRKSFSYLFPARGRKLL